MKRKNALIYGVMFGVIALFAVVFGSFAFLSTFYKDRILPRVWVGDVYVGGLDVNSAEVKIREQEKEKNVAKVQLKNNGRLIAQPTFAEIGVNPQIKNAVTAAVNLGKPRPGIKWLGELAGGLGYKQIPLPVLVYRPTFDAYLVNVLNPKIKVPQSANWVLDGTGVLQFSPATAGELIDQKKLAGDLLSQFNVGTGATIEIVLLPTRPVVGDQDAQLLKPIVEKILAEKFVFNAEGKKIEIPRETIGAWIKLERIDDKPMVTFAAELLEKYLRETVATQVKREMQDASFTMENGRVTQFTPALDGLELNIKESVNLVRSAVQSGQSEANLALVYTHSKVASTAELDRLGIKTLLATGETNFRGSPRNRVFNIGVGAARFNGVLIPAGATFGFNENLGPVGKATGYKPELVIKEHVTTPEYGGGLCQVSTTTFRAAILAGLPIVERSNHAYPVAYYGAPGFDATIYPNQRTWKDGTDLKFTNDTPANILIQTRVEGTKLIFEFWGTSDGREVKIVGPTSFDRKPDGSVKARLVQQIYKNGQVVREDVILSAYKSPALFPHVLAANAEKIVVAPSPTPVPILPSPSPKTTLTIINKDKTP